MQQLFAYLNSFPVCLPSMSQRWYGSAWNDSWHSAYSGQWSHIFLNPSPSVFYLSIGPINYRILSHRLQSLCSISGTILLWFESCHDGRTWTVAVNGRSSSPVDVFFVFHRAQLLVLSTSFSTLHLSPLWLKLILSPTSLLWSYFSPVLLIKYAPLSWPCRHTFLMWQPGRYKQTETKDDKTDAVIMKSN